MSAQHAAQPPTPTLTPQADRAPPSVLTEGFLTKRSITSVLGVHTWVKQYFVLDDTPSLAFYTTKQGKLKGQILLSQDTTIKLSDKRASCFELTTPYVTLFAQGKDDAERDKWIGAIMTAVQDDANTNKMNAVASSSAPDNNNNNNNNATVNTTSNPPNASGGVKGGESSASTTSRMSAERERLAKIKKKAQEGQAPKPTGRGTHVFTVAGQSFEVDTRYTFRKHIGQGAYGCVISAMDSKTETEVAIKKVKSVFDNVIDGKRILREIRLMRFLRHKNISHALDLMRPPPNTDGGPDDFNDVYIVMPLMDTDLHRVIYSPQKLTDQHVQFLLYQLLSACYYLDTCKVIHRDLKPSNILVNSACELRVCDFGLARSVDESNEEPITVYVVTRWYRAPELLMTVKEYTSAIDIWSVGCIMAELIGRKPLFPGDDYFAQISLIVDVLGPPGPDDLKFVEEGPAVRFIREMPRKPRLEWRKLPQLAHATEESLDLLDKLLTFSPHKRISAHAALQHPYLAAYQALPLTKSDRTFEGEDVGELEELTKSALRTAITKEIECYRKY